MTSTNVYIFDIETDGLYRDVSCIHCIGIRDLSTGEVFTYNDVGTKEPVVRAVTMLEEASTIIGHNIVNYDIPVIQKFYPWFTPPKSLDTLILSRLFKPDLLQIDKNRRFSTMPQNLYGRHSLEAYGHRLGEYKGGFAKQTDWKDWSQDMEDYMVQDLNVTYKLWMYFHRKYLNGSSSNTK